MLNQDAMNRKNSADSPRFPGLGAQKAGTTWLHALLDQHPRLCLPQTKETRFFDDPKCFDRGLDWYRVSLPRKLQTKCWER